MIKRLREEMYFIPDSAPRDNQAAITALRRFEFEVLH